MQWIDPASLPETRGKVTHFLLNPHGELDGLVVGARQVHVPPHLSKQLARHVALGDTVRVRGVKPRDADMIAAVSLTSAGGVLILDEGPHRNGEKHEKHEKPHVERKPMEASGEVVLSLFGPKGELRGALLDDGTSLRMPPHAAAELAAYLSPGAQVQAWGHGVKNRHGSAIEVDEIAELVDEPQAD